MMRQRGETGGSQGTPRGHPGVQGHQWREEKSREGRQVPQGPKLELPPHFLSRLFIQNTFIEHKCPHLNSTFGLSFKHNYIKQEV